MKTNQLTLAVNSNDMENEIFADLALAFADRPLFRFGFATDETAMDILLKHFADKICRAYRWRNHGGVKWKEAVLRFDDSSFVYIQNRYCKTVRIYCDSVEKAEALEKQVRALLPPPVKKPDEPWFYMLRKDNDSFSIEKIVNKSAALDEESLQICYGTDSPAWVSDFAKNTQAKSGGITILDGPPGTGKSTLIAELMRRLYPDGAAEEFISTHPTKYEKGEAVTFAITLKRDGRLIGGMGLNVNKRFRRAELGYWIAQPLWNQGYATEAGRALVEFGFEHWSLHKIEATYLSRNPASGRVMQKIGLVQEGLLRDHVIKWDRYEDLVTCAIIKT